MKRMKGDMFSVFDQVDHFIVCVCSNIRKQNHEAIMLNGLAGQLAIKYPGVTTAVGRWIHENGHDCGIYGLRCNSKLGVFQHMIANKDGCNLGVISMATKALKALAEANPDKTYALEAPNYQHPWFVIAGIMETLPDNVQVWEP